MSDNQQTDCISKSCPSVSVWIKTVWFWWSLFISPEMVALLSNREHQHVHQTLNATWMSLPVEVSLRSTCFHLDRARTGDRLWFVPLSSRATCLFKSWLLNPMKLQSLCDMATVSWTPPLGAAEVLLCSIPFFSRCTCAPSPWWGRGGGSQFWAPVTQHALVPQSSLR